MSTGDEMQSKILIVADDNDQVATRLGIALEKRERSILRLEGPSAARIFTLRGLPRASVVSPNLPMFIRPSAWMHTRSAKNSDEHFLREEAYATFWAAAALSSALVINRPTSSGPAGQFTSTRITAALGMATVPGPEVHASGPEMINDPTNETWGENVHFQSGPVALLPPEVPLRARKVHQDALYEIVTVVGSRAFPATMDPRTTELRLASRSVSIAQKFKLHFATITWSIDRAGATPVRLNATPEEAELQYTWNETVNALCEDLTQ
jgi:hypothetical protein